MDEGSRQMPFHVKRIAALSCSPMHRRHDTGGSPIGAPASHETAPGKGASRLPNSERSACQPTKPVIRSRVLAKECEAVSRETDFPAQETFIPRAWLFGVGGALGGEARNGDPAGHAVVPARRGDVMLVRVPGRS
jgi:hypothetical protein